MMDQVDTLAMEVWRSAEVQQARTVVEEMYRADPNAASPLAAARIASDVNEYAFAASLAAIADPWRPEFQWANAWKRSYRGLDVPAGRYGTDNTDNAYRFVAIGPGLSYRIEGQWPAKPPTAISFSLLTGNYAQTSQIRTLGLLTGKQMVVGADGRFVVTIDPMPANGRANHIQSTPEVAMLNLRETLADWGTELPARMTIVSTDAAPAPAPLTRRELAENAARILTQGAPHWALKFQHDSYEKLPFNQPQPVMSSGKRLGGLPSQSSSHGRFKLEEDEALVITVNPFDADYVGFQLADVWMVSADYAERTGSLNKAQTVADNDGRITYVIARRDPGVHNWLDAHGLDTGGTTIRYQGLKNQEADLSGAFETRLVKIAQLRDILPPETRWVTPAERKAQLERRKADYHRRAGPVLDLTE
jgi:hypothetical protein